MSKNSGSSYSDDGDKRKDPFYIPTVPMWVDLKNLKSRDSIGDTFFDDIPRESLKAWKSPKPNAHGGGLMPMVSVKQQPPSIRRPSTLAQALKEGEAQEARKKTRRIVVMPVMSQQREREMESMTVPQPQDQKPPRKGPSPRQSHQPAVPINKFASSLQKPTAPATPQVQKQQPPPKPIPMTAPPTPQRQMQQQPQPRKAPSPRPSQQPANKFASGFQKPIAPATPQVQKQQQPPRKAPSPRPSQQPVNKFANSFQKPAVSSQNQQQGGRLGRVPSFMLPTASTLAKRNTKGSTAQSSSARDVSTAKKTRGC